MHEFLTVFYLLWPLLVGLAFHGVCIKFGWLRSLARPITCDHLNGLYRLAELQPLGK